MMVVDGVEMLEIREAAKVVGRTPETVRRWIWSERLRAQKRGNRLLVARDDLQALAVPRGQEATERSFAGWSRSLPQTDGPGRSAADLVFEGRAARTHAGR